MTERTILWIPDASQTGSVYPTAAILGPPGVSFYLGEFADDASADLWATIVGIGGPVGLLYLNSETDKFRVHLSDGWIDIDATILADAEAAAASAAAAATSEANAANSASSAQTSADDAGTAQAAAASSEANAATAEANATTQAGIATAAASTATTEAGIATGAASTAATQAGIATGAAGTATTEAGVATTQAGIATDAASTATTQAGIATGAATTATTEAGIATTESGIATDAATTATTQAGIATTEAAIATTGGLTAQVAASSVLAAIQTGTLRTFASTADALSNGVLGLVVTANGSGGANGTFTGTFTGGGGTGAQFQFTVASGAVVPTSIVLTSKGTGYTSTPTPVWTASSGLTGVTATLTTGPNTVDTNFFNVATTSSVTTFQNQAGVAVQVYTLPISAASAPGAVFSVIDDYGFQIFSIDTTISAALNGLTINTATIASLTAPIASLPTVLTAATPTGELLGLIDDYGFPVFSLNRNGTTVGLSTGSTTTTVKPAGSWDAERDIFAITGQSLAVGVNNDAITLTPASNALMLSGGVKTHTTSPYTGQTLVALVEQTNGTGGSREGETFASASCKMVMDLVSTENGLTPANNSFELVAIAPGQGSTSISQHLSGQTLYVNFMAAVDQVIAQTVAANKSITAKCVGFQQGQTDIQIGTSYATYLANLKTLRASWNTDLKAKTGQAMNVRMLAAQVCSHSHYGVARNNIALAQLQASLDDPNIVIVCPDYSFEVTSDGVHLTAQEEKAHAAYFGLAYKRLVVDGGTWKCLRPIAKFISGNSVVVEFDVPVAPLVIDTVHVAAATNYGFTLDDGAGNPIAISTVALIGPTRLKITTASTLGSGTLVRAAFGPGGTYNAGKTTGPRTNLRDSAGDTLVFDAAGINRRMDNWCVLFEI